MTRKDFFIATAVLSLFTLQDFSSSLFFTAAASVEERSDEYTTTTDTCESLDPPETWRNVESIDECVEANIAIRGKEPNGINDSSNGPIWAPCGCTYHKFGTIDYWGVKGESTCGTKVKCTRFRTGDGELGCFCKRNIPVGGSNFPSLSPSSKPPSPVVPTRAPTESVPPCLQSCSSKKTNDECDGPDEIPRFLFAGQSNMVGHPNQNYNGLFDEIVHILNKSKKLKKKKIIKKLELALNNTREATEQSNANEARFLYKIKKYMKKKKITKDHENAVCSFTDPSRQSTLPIDCERPVSPTVCGGSGDQYGPELMFAHQFPKLKSPFKGQKIGIIKVAEGGTRIYNNWMKAMDGIGKNHWSLLASTIQAAKGSIEAFVWFQGENDHFGKLDTEEYLDNLRIFISDVRNEIFEASNKFNSSTKFNSPSDVPVVIVELGCWLYCGGRSGITDAQRTFVESDNNSILVETGGSDDEKKKMAKFYHYDSAATLIIGGRIAKKLASLLEANGRI